MATNPSKIIIFAGTRPECIKTVSLIGELRGRDGVDCHVLASGQHPAMVDATFRHFGIMTNGTLPPISGAHSLSHFLGLVRSSARERYVKLDPDLVIVQGDTTSAYAGALAARDCGIDVAHVEAGLRTSHPYRPFPEEHFRRRITPLARWHFAPTRTAAGNLLSEGVPAERVHVVGNTGIDALRLALADPQTSPDLASIGERGLVPVALTLHRRENYGRRLDLICECILAMLERHPGLAVLCPVHPNPTVGQRVRRMLGQHDRVVLTPPLPYREFVDVLRRSRMVVTDSGGIQEEAPYLGVPVIVVRENTERPEAALSGHAHLVGADPVALATAIDACLARARPAAVAFTDDAPFGDGRAAVRIVHHLLAS